jgi:hypothetical protein
MKFLLRTVHGDAKSYTSFRFAELDSLCDLGKRGLIFIVGLLRLLGLLGLLGFLGLLGLLKLLGLLGSKVYLCCALVNVLRVHLVSVCTYNNIPCAVGAPKPCYDPENLPVDSPFVFVDLPSLSVAADLVERSVLVRY